MSSEQFSLSTACSPSPLSACSLQAGTQQTWAWLVDAGNVNSRIRLTSRDQATREQCTCHKSTNPAMDKEARSEAKERCCARRSFQESPHESRLFHLRGERNNEPCNNVSRLSCPCMHLALASLTVTTPAFRNFSTLYACRTCSLATLSQLISAGLHIHLRRNSPRESESTHSKWLHLLVDRDDALRKVIIEVGRLAL